VHFGFQVTPFWSLRQGFYAAGISANPHKREGNEYGLRAKLLAGIVNSVVTVGRKAPTFELFYFMAMGKQADAAG
jgi:hypothetical protein